MSTRASDRGHPITLSYSDIANVSQSSLLVLPTWLTVTEIAALMHMSVAPGLPEAKLNLEGMHAAMPRAAT